MKVIINYVGRIDYLDSNRSTDLFYASTNRRKRQDDQNVFVPLFFDQLNYTREQIVMCENNQQCLFDLVVTGDVEIASNTLKFEKNTNATKESFGRYLITDCAE